MDFQEVIYSLLDKNIQACNAYFAVYQNHLPKSIKILTHKIESESFFHETNNNNWQLETTGFNAQDTYYIERESTKEGLGKHRLHEAGFFYMQEVAASLAAPVLSKSLQDVEHPLFILDMCAAPGGKSIQLADDLLTNNKVGIIISNEVNISRINALDYNIKRTGCYNTCVSSYGGEFFGKNMPEIFDGILVDAPCSGEGTGFKSDAGTKWRREENVHAIAHLQKTLLESAILACKPGGYVVYSTCTINPRENEMVVQYALDRFADSISLENVDIPGKSFGIHERENQIILGEADTKKVVRLRPHIHNTGGFFIAKFYKKTSTPNNEKNKTIQLPSQLTMNESLQTQIKEKLEEDYNIQINTQKHFFVATDTQVYLTSPVYKNIHGLLFTKKIGVPIFKKDKNALIPLHGLGQILGSLAIKNIIVFDKDQLQRYADGYDIEYTFSPSTADNFVIIKYGNYGISVGKIVNNTIKNKFLK